MLLYTLSLDKNFDFTQRQRSDWRPSKLPVRCTGCEPPSEIRNLPPSGCVRALASGLRGSPPQGGTIPPTHSPRAGGTSLDHRADNSAFIRVRRQPQPRSFCSCQDQAQFERKNSQLGKKLRK